MKKIGVLILLLSLNSVVAKAQLMGTSSTSHDRVTNNEKAEQLGVGITVGSYSGFVLDYWLTKTTALDFILASEYSNTIIGASHLWYTRDVFSARSRSPILNAMTPYLGVGLLAASGTYADYFDRPSQQNLALGVQVPLGIAFLPPTQRFSLSAQIAPTVGVAPVFSSFVTADLAARFYF